MRVTCPEVLSVVKVPAAAVVPPIDGGEARYAARSNGAGAIALPEGCHAGTKVWPEVVGAVVDPVVVVPV